MLNNIVLENIINHQRNLICLESKPIRLAVIKTVHKNIANTVIIHPRYIPKGVPHEIQEFRGYRRGAVLTFF